MNDAEIEPGPLVRVECATCGWFNESSDGPWVRHSGVVHTKMLQPGHVLVGAATVADFDPTTEQAERTARMLFARTTEGRNGFTWPLNGERDRERDLRDARQFLIAAIGPKPPADFGTNP